MKLMLLKAARIRHEAGEIVEVSPAEAGFLLSTGSAKRAEMNPPGMRETPEGNAEQKVIRAEKAEPKVVRSKKKEKTE